MKCSELLKLVAKLGIEMQDSKKKENLVRAIMSHYENERQVESTNEDVAPKKKVKRVKKAKKQAESEAEAAEQVDPVNQTMTRSRANAYMNQTLNKTGHLDEQEEAKETKKPKRNVQKKSSKKEEEDAEDKGEIIETRYEIREDGKKVKKIRRIKKKVKEATKPETQNVEEKAALKKIKKVKSSRKEEPEKVAEPESAENISEDQIEQNDFKLQLDEDEVEPPVVAVVEDNVNVAEPNELFNSSLMTNDEEKSSQNETRHVEPKTDLDITRDIMNTTFDKDEVAPVLACSSFYSKSAALVNERAIDVEDEKPEAVGQQVIEDNKNDEEEEEAPKPKAGGARIVRPKQTVTVIQTVKTARNETVVEEVKKVVEVVNREAGPRIVKPTTAAEEISVDPKRKNQVNESNASKVKKLKEAEAKKKAEADTAKVVLPRLKATPAPDFKAIHEKEIQKMESIDSYANRKHERFTKLSDKSPNPVSLKSDSASATQSNVQVKPKTPTISTKPTSIFAKKTPLRTDMTPKFAKNLASQASSFLSHIPKLLKRDDKEKEVKQDEAVEESKCVEPKTPESAEQDKRSKLLKTPTSVTRPTESSLLKSNIKRNQSLKVSLNDPTSLAALPPQLQSSSFVRRKSYDLSKSLTKPLGYNPHHGRLKKVDFSTKSVFLQSLQTNLNETKCADKSVLKANESILNVDTKKSKVSTVSKIRSDGACVDRNTVSDYIKSDKIKQITDKSTQMAKKIRMEKAKSYKQAKSDQNRRLDDDLENCENEQEC